MPEKRIEIIVQVEGGAAGLAASPEQTLEAVQAALREDTDQKNIEVTGINSAVGTSEDPTLMKLDINVKY